MRILCILMARIRVWEGFWNCLQENELSIKVNFIGANRIDFSSALIGCLKGSEKQRKEIESNLFKLSAK